MESTLISASNVAIISLGLVTACCARCVWPNRQPPSQPYKDVDGEATNESEVNAARLIPVAYSTLVYVPAIGGAMSIFESRSRSAELKSLQCDWLRWTGPVLWVSSCFMPPLRRFANTSPQVTADVPIYYCIPTKEYSPEICIVGLHGLFIGGAHQFPLLRGGDCKSRTSLDTAPGFSRCVSRSSLNPSTTGCFSRRNCSVERERCVHTRLDLLLMGPSSRGFGFACHVEAARFTKNTLQPVGRRRQKAARCRRSNKSALEAARDHFSKTAGFTVVIGAVGSSVRIW